MKLRVVEDKYITTDSVVDGEGLRFTLWTQGCPHACKGCHNPETWSKDAGQYVDVQDIVDKIEDLNYHTGITFSGGEPMEQAEALIPIAKKVKDEGMDVWLYTGYTFEELIYNGASPQTSAILDLIFLVDVLVVGRFEIDKLTLNSPYVGSSNQKLIDVKKTMDSGKIKYFDIS